MTLKNPILDVPLNAVMRPEIAMTLQQILKIYTVGGFLSAWRNIKNHRSIEQVFDSPQQARHAVAICAAWLGVRQVAAATPVPAWWNRDDQAAMAA